MIQVSIRRSELVAEGACSDGLALYDSILAHQNEHRGRRGLPARDRLVMRWSRLHTLMIATSHPGFHAWCVEHGILPQASLRSANLVGANLRGASLVGANLRSANLDGADLRGADLRGASLVGANLRSANLRGASLVGADLLGANLRGAKRGWHNAPIDGWDSDPDACGCCVLLRRAARGAK